MRWPGLRTLARVTSRFRRVEPGSFVLLYHRVTTLTSDPWDLCVTPQHFVEHLDTLRRHRRHLVRLRDLARRQAPTAAIAITFDDGYADNLTEAAPALERMNIPATVFIATGSIGSTREFWWDELEKILLSGRVLPAVLRLRIREREVEWSVGRPDALPARRNVYFSVWQALVELSPEERLQQMDALLEWSAIPPTPRESHRTLSLDGLRALARLDCFDIGAHTVSHSSLSALSSAERRREIGESRDFLESTLQRKVADFSYPYGRYCSDTMVATREAGFHAAFTTEAQPVLDSSDRYALPRVCVGNWSGKEFERRLRTNFGVERS